MAENQFRYFKIKYRSLMNHSLFIAFLNLQFRSTLYSGKYNFQKSSKRKTIQPDHQKHASFLNQLQVKHKSATRQIDKLTRDKTRRHKQQQNLNLAFKIFHRHTMTCFFRHLKQSSGEAMHLRIQPANKNKLCFCVNY